MALNRRFSLAESAVNCENGREQRAAAVGVVQVLDRGACNRQAVERRGAAPDLVEDDQRAFARLIENRGGLDHFHHEGRAPAREIVGCADARKQTVDDADAGLLRRHEAPHLGEHNDQRVLTQVGRFAGHVRAGDEIDAARPLPPSPGPSNPPPPAGEGRVGAG